MRKIRTLLGNVFMAFIKIDKKAYVSGLVIFTGLMITVLSLGACGYKPETNVSREQTYEAEVDESDNEPAEIVIKSTVDISDEILERYAKPALEERIQVQVEEVVLVTKSNSHSELEEADPLLTEKDYTALLNIVEAEATGEDMIGKIMIANVVLNRVESGRFPDTIFDVIHQQLNGSYQFSPLYDGRYYTVTVTDSTIEAVERAMAGEDYSNGALFFVARSLASENAVSWFDRNLEKVATHGVHEFYNY